MRHPTTEQIREQILLTATSHPHKAGTVHRTDNLLEQVRRVLGVPVQDHELLGGLQDLVHGGFLGWGQDIRNLSLDRVHVTSLGANNAMNRSRDPSNPSGYLNYIDTEVPSGTVARSYIEEALQTYIHRCYKGSAVLVGCACEALILDLRAALIARMRELGITVPTNVTHQKVKTYRDAMAKVFEDRKASMTTNLRERVGANWTGFTEPVRRLRNDAGHPNSIEPVTPEDVHAALLLFPEFARLARDLRDWVANGLQP